MQMIPALVVLLSLGLATSTAPCAEPRSAEDVAVEFIIGNCFYPIDDISRVKAAALLFKWQPISADAANMLKPVDGSDFEAWHARDERHHFLVGVSRGKFRGRPADACSIAVNQRPDAILPRLFARLKARKVSEDGDPLQLFEVYERSIRPSPTL